MFLLHLMTFQSFYWISQGFIGVHGVAPEIVSFFLVFFFFYRVLPWLPTIRRRIRFPGLYFFFFFCLRVLEVDRESVTAPRNLSEPGEKKKKKNIERKPNQTHTHTHTQTSSAIEKKQKKKQRPNKDPADLPAMATKPNGPFRRKKRKRKKNKKQKRSRYSLARSVPLSYRWFFNFFYVVISFFFFPRPALNLVRTGPLWDGPTYFVSSWLKCLPSFRFSLFFFLLTDFVFISERRNRVRPDCLLW